MRPARGAVYVTPIQTAELQRGIILLEDTRGRVAANQMQVVAVGLPEVCEDRDDCRRPDHAHAFDDPPNKWVHWQAPDMDAWVLIRPRSLVPVAQDGAKLYSVKQSDVLAVIELADATENATPAGDLSLERRAWRFQREQADRDHAAKFGESYDTPSNEVFTIKDDE